MDSVNAEVIGPRTTCTLQVVRSQFRHPYTFIDPLYRACLNMFANVNSKGGKAKDGL